MKKSIFGVIVLLSMVLLLLGTVSLSFATCCDGDCSSTTPVPEPSTFILFGSMLIGAVVVKKVITWDS